MNNANRVSRCGAVALVATLLLLPLAGCVSSTASDYYTLSSAAPTPAASVSPHVIDVLPVQVPVAVDQPYVLLSGAQGKLVPLYSSRWAAPLSDEVRAALSAQLHAQLNAVDLQGLSSTTSLPVWRIQVALRQFAIPDATGPARLSATWRLTQQTGTVTGVSLLCQATLSQPIGAGGSVVDRVAAQRQALASLSARITQSVLTPGSMAPDSSCQPG